MANSALVRDKAQQIIRLSEGLTPREFLAAMAIASGSFIHIAWAPEARQATAQAHALSVMELATGE